MGVHHRASVSEGVYCGAKPPLRDESSRSSVWRHRAARLRRSKRQASITQTLTLLQHHDPWAAGGAFGLATVPRGGQCSTMQGCTMVSTLQRVAGYKAISRHRGDNRIPKLGGPLRTERIRHTGPRSKPTESKACAPSPKAQEFWLFKSALFDIGHRRCMSPTHIHKQRGQSE